MKTLYRFHWDCGRSGDVEGVFVADHIEIMASIGTNLDFGSCLGKHSEVYGELSAEDLTVVTQNQDFIARFEELFPNGIGKHPLNSYTE